MLSALTDGESFDVVMSAGGDHGFKLHEVETEHSRTSAKSLEGDSVASATKVA